MDFKAGLVKTFIRGL